MKSGKKVVIRVSKKRTNRPSGEGPNDVVAKYDGPISVPHGPVQLDEVVRNMSSAGAVSATGGGVFSGIYSSDPTGLTDWASVSGEFDEYRVLGIRVEYLPYNKFNQTVSVANAVVTGVGFVVSDLNDTAVLTSVQNASQYASAQFIHTGDRYVHTVRASTRNLMTWNPISSSPTYFMAIKHYITGIAVSTTFGVIWAKYLIQFRGTTD